MTFSRTCISLLLEDSDDYRMTVVLWGPTWWNLGKSALCPRSLTKISQRSFEVSLSFITL